MKTELEYWRKVGVAALAACVLTVAGCQQKMARQPSAKPLVASSFFRDGRSARPLVPGTIARGHLRTDTALFAGRTLSAEARAAMAAAVVVDAMAATGGVLAATILAADDNDFVGSVPIPVTEEMLQHGRDRFMIYCVVCHDPLGTGHGKIVERGYTPPPSYHIERLRKAPIGRFFAVMTEGYGSMPSYEAQIPVPDRWAIATYIRALQLSQRFPVEQLPADLREKIVRGARAVPAEVQAP
jgi:mono/diheme cytochrome c family protein